MARTSWIFCSLSGARRKHHLYCKRVAELAACVCIGSWLAAGHGSSQAGQTLAAPLIVTLSLFHIFPILLKVAAARPKAHGIAKDIFGLLWSESLDCSRATVKQGV